MKKIIFIFLFFPIVCVAQEYIDLKNSTLDSLNYHSIGNANIYNFDLKNLFFTIKMPKLEFIEKKKDTLTYKLPETYAEFKKEFFNTKFREFHKKVDGTTLTAIERAQFSPNQNGLLALIPGKVGEAIMHPISFLYNTFSRKMKMERLYKELVANQEEVYNLSQKYNQDLVASITGLEGEELLNFMTFCKFSYYDLVRWTPEHIVLQIKTRYDDYAYYKAKEEGF